MNSFYLEIFLKPLGLHKRNYFGKVICIHTCICPHSQWYHGCTFHSNKQTTLSFPPQGKPFSCLAGPPKQKLHLEIFHLHFLKIDYKIELSRCLGDMTNMSFYFYLVTCLAVFPQETIQFHCQLQWRLRNPMGLGLACL